jgi:competence ComEA-like helix-hairpin-helix protein
MRQEIRQYFIFNKQEKRTIIAMLCIAIGIIGYYFFMTDSKNIQANVDKQTLIEIEAFKQEYEAQLEKQKLTYDSHKESSSSRLFYFDPNLIGEEEWMQLGLSKRQAEVIERYKSKGGKFRKPEDIRKIFVISDEKKEAIFHFVRIENSEKSQYHSQETSGKNEEQKTYELFQFDPNIIDVAGWMRLGLTEKQATVIQNYKLKGGKFRKAEDIKKIFVLSDEKKEELLPYVQIGVAEAPQTFKSDAKVIEAKYSEEKSKFYIDINTADSAQFERLYGIGPKLASRIVQYREALGGFYAVSQVGEVYGLSDSTYQSIRQFLRISRVPIRKLPINSSDYNMLKKHPYTRALAYRIVKYRESNTSFKSLDHICRVPDMTEDICLKIQRYIVLE